MTGWRSRGLSGQIMGFLFQKSGPSLTGRTLKQAGNRWASTACSLMRELFKTASLESTPFTAMPDVRILLAVNGKTPEETRMLYEKILAAAGLE